MDISTVRPKVAQLTFQLLSRSVHPELFHIHKTQSFPRENYQLKVDITSDGHVIQWIHGNSTISEIASSNLQPVPQGRHILEKPLRHNAKDRFEPLPGLEYEYAFELQHVKPALFWMIQKQLKATSETHELIHVFDSSGRIAIGGLSFVNVETRLKSACVQAIHTFPDDLALVKTESTLRVVEDGKISP